MARIAEIARVRTETPDPESEQIVQDAFLLWKSVVSECERKRLGKLHGKFVYRHPLINHVSRLWPTLGQDELMAKSRELYIYLRDSGNARCVSTHNPTVWHVSPTWQQSEDIKTRVVFRMTPRERRLSAREAGEDLPAPPVTTKTKEKPQVTETMNDQSTRLELIQLALAEAKQPLVGEEIAHLTGLEISSVRKDLNMLRTQNKVGAREETLEERQTRFGGMARASRAVLYSATSPVPTRTEREAVKGFVKEQMAVDRTMSTAEVERRLACKFNKMGARAKFTATSLANSSGVVIGTLRARIREFEEGGMIEHVGHDGGAKQYKIKNKAKLLEFLNFQEKLPNGNGEPKAATPQPPVPTPPATLGNPLARIAEVLDENERLREQNARLKARVAELESAVDTAALERLAQWTPSV